MSNALISSSGRFGILPVVWLLPIILPALNIELAADSKSEYMGINLVIDLHLQKATKVAEPKLKTVCDPGDLL